MLGHSDTLAYERWPPYDEALLVQDTINLPVQVRFIAYARMRAQALLMHGTRGALLSSALLNLHVDAAASGKLRGAAAVPQLTCRAGASKRAVSRTLIAITSQVSIFDVLVSLLYQRLFNNNKVACR